jgi:hypothetical protein
MLTFLGKAYEATVAGKKFYLQTVGERERCMNAISRILDLDNPIETKGPEGEEQAADGEEGGASAASAPEAAPATNTPAEEEAGTTES